MCFLSIGYLLAPFFAGLLISDVIDATPFIGAWIFLGIAFLFFILFIFLLRKNKEVQKKEVVINTFHKKRFYELRVWEMVAKNILPLLSITLMLSIIDSTFWTIGPLIAEEWTNLGGMMGSLFMGAYLLPFLLVGGMIGTIAQRFGKFKTSNRCLLIGSLIFSMFFFISNPIILIILTFIATIFFAISLPVNSGLYADCIAETKTVKSEIESQADFITNLGCVIGPMLAGVLADYLGNIATFSVGGVMGVIVAIILSIHHRVSNPKVRRLIEKG